VVKQSVVQLDEVLARLQEEFSFRANVQSVELRLTSTDAAITIFADEAKLVSGVIQVARQRAQVHNGGGSKLWLLLAQQPG